MGTIKTTNIEPIATNGTVTLGSSGDTFTLGSGVTQTIAVNTPAFFAYSASDQNLTDNTYSKLTLGTEVFDTNGAFASSRFTVPSGQAGKYFFYGSVRTTTSSDTQLQDSYAAFYLNGSRYLENRMNFNNNYVTVSTNLIHVVLDLDVADYVELYGAANTTSSQARAQANEKSTNFGGYKIIE